VLLKGLIVAKRVKNFLACYGTHKSIEPVVPLLSYLNSIQSLKVASFNSLNAELNPICHLLALLGAHHILHVSRIRVKGRFNIYLLILNFPRYIFPQSCRLFSFPPIA
jgi:hypothetical protein